MNMQTVLYFVSYWPQPSFSAASQRSLQLIQHLLDAGFEVIVSADGPFLPGLHGLQSLEAMGCRCLRLRANDPEALEAISQIMPQVVLFDKFTTEEKFGWQVSLKAPQALRVLDTIDLHWLRKGREAQVKELDRQDSGPWSDHSILKSPGTSALIAQASGDLFERELASIYRCDTALLVSEVERDILQQWCQVPAYQLFTNQLCYQTLADFVPSSIEFTYRQNFYFIGNFRHTPNLDAVHWLKQILWPQIRQGIRDQGIDGDLHVYGASSETQAHRALHDPKGGFHLKGHGTEIDFRRYRVNLAPLRFGAGIKGKIAEGWSYGVPAITTPVGAEGMHGALPFGGSVVSTTADFVAAAVASYTQEESWIQHSQAGLDVIRAGFSLDEQRIGFQNHIKDCLEKKLTLRQNNFMGRILNHQSMRATEYFSRWIQVKQKLQHQGLV